LKFSFHSQPRLSTSKLNTIIRHIVTLALSAKAFGVSALFRLNSVSYNCACRSAELFEHF